MRSRLVKVSLIASMVFSFSALPVLAERNVSKGVIDCDISPDEALTYLDATYLGTADDLDGRPEYLYVEPGIHIIEFRYEDYQTLRIRFEITAGEKINFDNKLVELAQNTPPARYLDLVKTSSKVKSEAKKRLPQPESQPKTRDEDESAVVREREIVIVEVQTNEAPTPQPEPPRLSAYLILAVEPADAAVWIDQMFIGTARQFTNEPNQISVTPGEHVLELTRPGYVSIAVRLKLADGERKLIEAELKQER